MLSGLLMLPLVAQATPAGAAMAVACSFSEVTRTVEVTASAPVGDVVIRRSGAEIEVLEGDIPADCVSTEPTVTTVDSVVLDDDSNGSVEFVLDLTGGRLEPGFTSEGPGQSEIEITADMGAGFHDTVRVSGTGGDDVIEFDGSGIDLNDDLDSDDLVTTNAEEYAVFGGNGEDTIDGGGASQSQGFADRLSLGGGDDADELIGGAIGDTLEGGADADSLVGGDGPDELFGDGGGDDLEGRDGADRIEGGDGGDQEAGGDGDDTFDQGPFSNGADSISGGGGTLDLVAFDLRSIGVAVALNGLPDDGQTGESDNVGSDVEGALGGAAGDDLTGTVADNIFEGGGGPDDIVGAGGADSVTGGPGADGLGGGTGVDTASYFSAPGGMVVDLVAGSASGPHGPDILDGFENVGGSGHADVLSGDQTLNELLGRGGDDVLTGQADQDLLAGGTGADQLAGGPSDDDLSGGGGNDQLAGEGGDDGLDGDEGRDAADYSQTQAPVTADLGDGLATGDGTDTLSGIENLIGGPLEDVLRGGGVPSVLIGNGAADTLQGRGGPDQIDGGPGVDDLRGGTEDDDLDGGVGQDVMVAGGGADRLRGGGEGDDLRGEEGRDELRGQGGNDSLDGGAGRDDCTQGPGAGPEIRCEA
jgi:Ca2+-binding RTX toxin-like protein